MPSLCGFILLALMCFGAKAEHHNHGQINTATKGFASDFLLFPDLTYVGLFNQSPSNPKADNEFLPSLNLFYSADYNKFRFLGEWLVSSKSHNVERLQFGVNLGESSLWLGRFHSPIGYWNMQYHHGAYLQTPISRPGIMAFETGGGVIPNHLTGLLWEGVHIVNNAGIYYTLGAGAAPDLTNRLHPFNIFDPKGSHRPGVALRLGYQPVSYGPDEIGLSFAYTELPGEKFNAHTVKQIVASTYANWQINETIRSIGEIVYVHHWTDHDQLTGRSQSGSFVNAYGQLEWDIQPKWTLFGRLEHTFGAHNDTYLAAFPKFVEGRLMGGIRYKLPHNMALKVEASEEHVRNEHYGQVMLQWSALWP